MDLDEVLAATFTLVAPHLTEWQRRLLLGAAARGLRSGGVSRVARLAEAWQPRVRRGAAELDHDTAVFAVQTLRRWWQQVGRVAYPRADRQLVCADAGGSNGYRIRAWKTELTRLAEETGLRVTVCHLPPGTSKWNRIEKLAAVPLVRHVSHGEWNYTLHPGRTAGATAQGSRTWM